MDYAHLDIHIVPHGYEFTCEVTDRTGTATIERCRDYAGNIEDINIACMQVFTCIAELDSPGNYLGAEELKLLATALRDVLSVMDGDSLMLVTQALENTHPEAWKLLREIASHNHSEAAE